MISSVDLSTDLDDLDLLTDGTYKSNTIVLVSHLAVCTPYGKTVKDMSELTSFDAGRVLHYSLTLPSKGDICLQSSADSATVYRQARPSSVALNKLLLRPLRVCLVRKKGRFNTDDIEALVGGVWKDVGSQVGYREYKRLSAAVKEKVYNRMYTKSRMEGYDSGYIRNLLWPASEQSGLYRYNLSLHSLSYCWSGTTQDLVDLGLVHKIEDTWLTTKNRSFSPYAGFSIKVEPLMVCKQSDILNGSLDMELKKYEPGLTNECIRMRIPTAYASTLNWGGDTVLQLYLLHVRMLGVNGDSEDSAEQAVADV